MVYFWVYIAWSVLIRWVAGRCEHFYYVTPLLFFWIMYTEKCTCSTWRSDVNSIGLCGLVNICIVCNYQRKAGVFSADVCDWVSITHVSKLWQKYSEYTRTYSSVRWSLLHVNIVCFCILSTTGDGKIALDVKNK